jgi:hypothetical protein
LFVAVSTYSTVSAQVEEYLPLTQTELSKRFPLRYHGKIEKRERIIQITGEQSLSTIQISMTEELILTGQDERHIPWSFHIQGYGNLYPYDLYTADLDRNAYEDILLLVSTGGGGLAPTMHLITLLFDASGRPIPFEAEGYWKHDEQSMTGLVDLDNNGKAELIYMHFDDDYWITNLYTANTARWQRIVGAFATRNYPLFTRFTSHPNKHAESAPDGRHQFSPDLSNTIPRLHGQFVSYQWADIMLSEDIRFTLNTQQGEEIVCSPVSWYASFTVVIDTAERREMASLSARGHTVKRLLDEIISQQYEVAVYGQRRADRCSPELLWAQPSSSAQSK